MAPRSPEDRVGAFVRALDGDDQILIIEDGEDTTAVTPPERLEALAAESTPPPALRELHSQAQAMSDRWRHSVRVMLGLPEDLIDALAKYAHEHMPRGRR